MAVVTKRAKAQANKRLMDALMMMLLLFDGYGEERGACVTNVTEIRDRGIGSAI